MTAGLPATRISRLARAEIRHPSGRRGLLSGRFSDPESRPVRDVRLRTGRSKLRVTSSLPRGRRSRCGYPSRLTVHRASSRFARGCRRNPFPSRPSGNGRQWCRSPFEYPHWRGSCCQRPTRSRNAVRVGTSAEMRDSCTAIMRFPAEQKLPVSKRPCVDGPPLASGFVSFALLVGAAMCPTCLCGTYSRWP
jgi:hypothetical protein